VVLPVTNMAMVSNIEVKSDKFNLATIGLSANSRKKQTLSNLQPLSAFRCGFDPLKKSKFAPEKSIPATGHGGS
jgi:hypothetical protein